MIARKTVQRLAYTPGVPDVLGNVTDTWADPVEVKVFGWQAGNQTNQGASEPARDVFADTLTLMAPAGTVGWHRDRWLIASGPGGTVQEWGEQGDAMDLAQGNPVTGFGGVVINLGRVEG